MSLTTCIPEVAKIALLPGGDHSPSDTYKCALYTNTAVFDADSTVYAASGEITGTGYSAGGVTLSGMAVTQDNDLGGIIITFNDATWTTSTFSADGAIIYNASKGDKILWVCDFSGTYGVVGSSFVLPLSNGIVFWQNG